MSYYNPLRVIFLTILSISLLGWVTAAPSGGPYGPRNLSYEIPTDATKVIYVSPEGEDDADGATLATPTTVENAVGIATSGTVIVLREGTYRTGDLTFNQGITFQPYEDEKVVFKGTKVATEWESHREGYWRVKWDSLFPAKAADWWRRGREGMYTPPWNFNNDMVFCDGKLLKAKGWEGELDEESYVIDYDLGYVYIAFDPNGKEIEITAWDGAIIRTIEELNGVKNDQQPLIIKGITFTQYAYRAIELEGIEPEGPQAPETYGRDVVGSIFEDVTISYCSRVAGYFRGDEMVFRHCLISDTGTEGLYIIGSSNVLLERNIVTRTNLEPITGYYASAVKIFNQSDNVTVRDNLIIDNWNASGVWWDVGNDHAVFVNNWVENTQNGFFFEISQMAICAGNVFVNCPKGAWSLNSRDVEFYHNTFVNSQLSIHRNTRSAANDHFGWHPATGPDVDERENHVITHNLMVGTPEFADSLLWVSQAESLCDTLTSSQIKELHSNVFVRESSDEAAPALSLSPVSGNADCTKTYATLAELEADFPAYMSDTEIWEDYPASALVNLKLHNISLQDGFPGNATVNTTPASIRQLIGFPEDVALRRGAYSDGKM